MLISEKEVSSVTETVWSELLGLRLEPAAKAATQPNGSSLTAIIHIEGAWTGAAVLSCSRNLAKTAASIMFSLDGQEPANDEVRDALGELANVIGGNLKAMLPGPSHLSLPTVVEGDAYLVSVSESVPYHAAHFRCDEEPLQVNLVVHDASVRRIASTPVS